MTTAACPMPLQHKACVASKVIMQIITSDIQVDKMAGLDVDIGGVRIRTQWRNRQGQSIGPVYTASVK